MHRTLGYHTSAIIWLFSFLSLLLALPSLYTFSAFYRSNSEFQIENIAPHSLIFFLIHFVLLFVLFLLTCVADRKPPKDTNAQVDKSSSFDKQKIVKNGKSNSNSKDEVKVADDNDKFVSNVPLSKECPDQSASFLSLLTFWWLNDLTITGYKKVLQLEDLPLLSEENLTEHIEKQYDDKWLRNEGIQSKKTSGEPGILGTIIRAWALSFAAGAALKLASEMIQFVNPQLQKYVSLLLSFISNLTLFLKTNQIFYHFHFQA